MSYFNLREMDRDNPEIWARLAWLDEMAQRLQKGLPAYPRSFLGALRLTRRLPYDDVYSWLAELRHRAPRELREPAAFLGELERIERVLASAATDDDTSAD